MRIFHSSQKLQVVWNQDLRNCCHAVGFHSHLDIWVSGKLDNDFKDQLLLLCIVYLYS